MRFVKERTNKPVISFVCAGCKKETVAEVHRGENTVPCAWDVEVPNGPLNPGEKATVVATRREEVN